MNKIIVGLTSWPGRINFIGQTLDSIVKQEILPDEFYLILSEKEFPNKEADLPKYILDFKDQYSFFKIEWTSDNLKNFKKTLPLIKKYINDTSVILYIIDDDVYYEKNYIKDTLKEFLLANTEKNTVITWNFPWNRDSWVRHPEKQRLIGHFSIYRPCFFKPIVYSIKESDLYEYEYLSEDNWISYNLRQNNINFKMLPYEDLVPLYKYTKTEKISPLNKIHHNIRLAKIQAFIKLCYNKYSNVYNETSKI